MRSGGGPKLCAGRQTKPRLRHEAVAALAETALQHQKLAASAKIQLNNGARRPTLEAHVFHAIRKQRHGLDASPAARRHERPARRVDANLGAIRWIELPELHEDGAAWLRTGSVRRGRRVAEIETGREVTVLVLKHAFEHKEFLTATMSVGGKWLLGAYRTIEVARATSAPIRSSMRRSTPTIGEGVQGRRAP
jgi:hypothetical protein